MATNAPASPALAINVVDEGDGDVMRRWLLDVAPEIADMSEAPKWSQRLESPDGQEELVTTVRRQSVTLMHWKLRNGNREKLLSVFYRAYDKKPPRSVYRNAADFLLERAVSRTQLSLI